MGSAAAPAAVAFSQQPGRILITLGGKPFTLRYGILLHAGPDPDLEAADADYLGQLKGRTP